MRELMLELLTYEPFGEFLPEEEKYINEVLSEKKFHRPPSEVHDLFSGFHYYVHRKDAKDKDKTKSRDKSKDIDWLRIWKNTYHRKRNNTSSATTVRSPDSFPLLFRKVCFYIIVRGDFTDKEFAKILDMTPSSIQKWGISTQFRKYAEANTYSEIRLSRNGVKKEYVVSAIKKLYFEAGRQVSRSMKLKDLPTFVDVFAGSATVAASVRSEACPPPIVNDYDPVMVCFAWAFTHCQSELRKRIAEFHNNLMKLDFASTNWRYNSVAYEGYVDKKDFKDVHINPKRWDDPKYQEMRMFFYDESPEMIKEGKELAQRHQEFIMRTRSSYIEELERLKSCDRDDLRSIDFNKLSPHSIKQIENVLEYAFAVFYKCSFHSKGNIYHESIVSAESYFSYLRSLLVKKSLMRRVPPHLHSSYISLVKNLNAIKGENRAVKAEGLTNLRLDADLLTPEDKGPFSRYLRDAKFYCKDFKDLLQVPEVPSDGIYYWDSPYFLTVGYDVDFFDNKHKDMLDILRDA